MKSGFPVLLCLFLFILGCSKDKFEVKPTIRIKSYTQTVAPGGTFNAVLGYSQKKGVIEGDTLVAMRHRYTFSANPSPDTFFTILDGQIPNSNQADFNVTLDYSYLRTGGDSTKNDTIDFQFALIDLAGRSSDTVKTGKIVILP